ncbi:MAG: RNA-directed DNA polymerase [Patescibacteria group bacterium]|nr:RNA-directed DNA polymerase [Patescibacteria group bacterium]
MNEFDYFIKHSLRIKNYLRYTDDFVIVLDKEEYLVSLIPKIKQFLKTWLKLELHSNKVSIKKFNQGVDFLGYIIFPKYRLLRTKTKRRIYNKLKQKVAEYKEGVISEDTLKQSLNSYLGVLSHADCYKVQQDLLNQFWFWMKE